MKKTRTYKVKGTNISYSKKRHNIRTVYLNGKKIGQITYHTDRLRQVFELQYYDANLDKLFYTYINGDFHLNQPMRNMYGGDKIRLYLIEAKIDNPELFFTSTKEALDGLCKIIFGLNK